MDLVATGNSLALDDQYMGYSMAVIKIKGTKQRYAEEYILVGTPKGNNLTGEVSNHFHIVQPLPSYLLLAPFLLTRACFH